MIIKKYQIIIFNLLLLFGFINCQVLLKNKSKTVIPDSADTTSHHHHQVDEKTPFNKQEENDEEEFKNEILKKKNDDFFEYISQEQQRTIHEEEAKKFFENTDQYRRKNLKNHQESQTKPPSILYPTGETSSSTGRSSSFSCTKRALLLYTISMTSLLKKLQSLQSYEKSSSSENLQLQLQISTREINEFKIYLNQIKRFVLDEDKNIIHFCRILDQIEQQFSIIIKKLSILSTSSIKEDKISENLLTSISKYLISQFSRPELMLSITVTLIVAIILFGIIPHINDPKKKALVIILIIILFTGLFSEYRQLEWEDKIKINNRIKEKQNKLENPCSDFSKSLNWLRFGGFQCSPESYLEASLKFTQHITNDLDEEYNNEPKKHHNLLDLLLRLFSNLLLKPLKHIASELFELIEHLMIGKDGDSSQWSLSTYLSALIFNLFRVIFAILAIYLAIILSPFQFILRFICYIFYPLYQHQQNQQQQQQIFHQNQEEQGGEQPALQQQQFPQLTHHHHQQQQQPQFNFNIHNYHRESGLVEFGPRNPAPSVRHRQLRNRNNLKPIEANNEDNDEVYFSAPE